MRTALLVLASIAASLPAQNSRQKIRRPPGDIASRAGSAVRWRPDLAAALREAAATNLLVFWYVPTLRGSPMDRRPEIDRYMMAGPFSWPSTIDLLNDHFVPVRLVPEGDLQKRYGLERLSFIEPGWIVLDGRGREKARLDRITTLHPTWFEAPLRRLAGLAPVPLSDALQDAFAAYAAGDRGKARELAGGVLLPDVPPQTRAMASYLIGAALCRDHRRAEAETIWRDLAAALPDQPLAWKAAMEAEGHGPFVRGFEDYLDLPAIALRDLDEGSRAVRGSFTEQDLWRRGASFLASMDGGDGVIRDSIYDFGGTDSLPNVHLAITALAGSALLQGKSRLGEAGAGAIGEAIDAALARMRSALSDESRVADRDRDEILWAHAYRIRFFADWMDLRGPDDGVRAALQRAVDALQALQPEDGVWFHEYGNPFAIATALDALARARDAGAEVDAERIRRGLAALARCRTKDGIYSYGYPRRGEARSPVEFGAGRAPLCELALFRHGASGPDRLAEAVRIGMEQHGRIAAVRKYDDHADRFGNGGFFFWYDMLGRSEAIAALPAGAERDRWRAQQKKLVLDLPEFDGCFVDSHELGRAYGTAMALLCLAALD
ncbi:MAG: hypothetical protein Fur0037_18230 [Planctomycetota bacterium]